MSSRIRHGCQLPDYVFLLSCGEDFSFKDENNLISHQFFYAPKAYNIATNRLAVGFAGKARRQAFIHKDFLQGF